MSYLGLNKLGKVYLGTTEIAKVYLGTNLVYQKKSSSTLPYDAEIEYLEATGTQYIDTGIKPTTNFKSEIKGQYLQNNDNFDTLLGCYDGTNFGVAVGLQSTSGGNKLYVQLGRTYNALNNASTLTLHTFTSQLSNSIQSIDIDGTTNTASYSGNLPDMTFYLFARNRTTTAGSYSNAKIYYCKIWNGGNLVRDFIPVRVGQVGYMYDKVSGQLFGNLGTNNFILGDDKIDIDMDGLIGYWNYEDAAVNGNWVDRINSFQLQLGGTAAKTSDGYRFNNLSSPRNAYALFNYNSNSTLNSLIDKTFTCIVYCSIKFTATDKSSSIIDFGSLGSSFSGISILAAAGQNGNVSGNFKVDGNSSSGWEERNNPVVGNAIPTGEYVNYPIKLGTRILDNGKQEAFFEANGVRANAIKTTPVKVNFSGCATSGTGSCAFGLGITYLSGQSVTQYASNYLCDIYYRKILLYNKPK